MIKRESQLITPQGMPVCEANSGESQRSNIEGQI